MHNFVITLLHVLLVSVVASVHTAILRVMMIKVLWFVCVLFDQLAQNYFMQAAEAGNANAMAFLGKVTLINFIRLYLMLICSFTMKMVAYGVHALMKSAYLSCVLYK